MPREWSESFAWHGEGNGKLEFGRKTEVGVEWELVQTTAGSLFLLVRANGSTSLGSTDLELFLGLRGKPSLSGVDTHGSEFEVVTEGRCSPVHVVRANEGWITLRVREAHGSQAGTQPVAFRFALVNLCLDQPPQTSWVIDGKRLTASAVPQYEDVVATLYTRDRIAVTTWVTIETRDSELAQNYCDILCELASIGCGCRVAWLHVEGVDSNGKRVAVSMRNAITGPFVSLPLFVAGDFWKFLSLHWSTYAAWRTKEPQHARRVLGLLLNATSPDDFIELRGLKLASAMEAVMTLHGQSGLHHGFASNTQRDRFLSAVRGHIRAEATRWLEDDTLHDTGRRNRLAERFAAKAIELLRPTFAEQIANTSKLLAIDWDQKKNNQLICPFTK